MTRGLGALVAGAGALLVAAACAPMETAPRLTPQQIAAQTDARIVQLDPLAGRYAAGDFASTWVAYFDDGDLLLIEERGVSGDYGEGTHRFYFHDGTLIYYSEESVRRMVMGLQPIQQHVSIRASFRSGGGVIEGTKLVDGVPAPLDPFELQSARGHGVELQARALASSG